MLHFVQHLQGLSKDRSAANFKQQDIRPVPGAHQDAVQVREDPQVCTC